MKPVCLYDVLVKLEKGDLVAIVGGRLWIRDNDNVYVSLDRIKENKASHRSIVLKKLI